LQGKQGRAIGSMYFANQTWNFFSATANLTRFVLQGATEPSCAFPQIVGKTVLPGWHSMSPVSPNVEHKVDRSLLVENFHLKIAKGLFL